MNPKYEKLRELAEKAAPGPRHIHRGGDYQSIHAGEDVNSPTIVWCGSHMNEQGDWVDCPDIEFYGALTPKLVLSLLDTLKAVEKERDEYHDDLMREWERHADE